MQIGDTLANRFVIERLAGHGGMGAVYRALDLASGRPVAVKLLYGRRGGDILRFLREARILSTIEDAHIVRHVAHGTTDDGLPWLVMEWLDGRDLAVRLTAGRLGVREAVAVCRGVAGALAALHDLGIVHRDLKPSNIYLERDCVDGVKLLDFGIAHVADSTRMTATGALIGTAGYMAPEQAKAADAIGSRADVFALGCVLFEMLAGEHAFQGDHPMALLTKILFADPPRLSERCVGVPPALGALVDSMLAKQPTQRPADGRAVANMLDALGELQEEPLERATEPVVPATLTDSEQRALAILLIDMPRPDAPTEDAWLAAEAATHGATWERLVDGSIALLLASTAIATDLAARAALCALALGRRVEGRRITLAMGRNPTSARGTSTANTAKGALGSAIDRAARLHAERSTAPAPGDATVVTVDDVAAGLLEARFHLHRDHDVLVLVGERDVTEVRTLLGQPTPCVGRERELRSLEALYRDCTSHDGGAQVALVTGPPGSGKSRLGRELLRTLEVSPDAVSERPSATGAWVARAEPQRAGSSFALLAGLVQSACAIRGGEPLEERRARLSARVAAAVAVTERPRVTEFLGELVGAPFASEDSVRLRAARNDAQLMSTQVRAAFHDFLAAECAAHPVLLVLEDLHWGDHATVEALDEALGALEDGPLFVLALARPEVHTTFPGLWSARLISELRLRELPRRAAERLVRHVLGARATEALVTRVLALSDGNAFYLEELIRAAADGAGDDLPETIVAMVQSRLGALPDEDRRLLRAASIYGETLWGGAVTALVGDGPRVAARLDALVTQEILVPRAASRFADEREYAFRHALLREGAYAMLTDEDRTLGHRLAAEWLEQRGEDDALVLAEHFECGGDSERAGAHYLRAADRAGRGGDSLGGIQMVRRGLAGTVDAAIRAALLGMSCQLHYHRIELLDDARADATELLQTARPGSAPWAQAMLVAITSAVKDGRMEDFARALPPVLAAEFEPAAHDPASLTLATICYLLDLGGSVGPANMAFARLEALTRAAAEHAPSVTALYHLLGALRRPSIEQDPWAGREEARRARAKSEEIGHRKYASVAVLFGALDTWLLGAHAEARRTAIDADPAADESGFASSTRPFMLAWLNADLGALDEAQMWAERLVGSGQARGLPLDEARGHWVLGEVLRCAGRLDAADRELDLALRQVRAVSPIDLPAVLASVGHLRLAQRRPLEALAATTEATALTTATGTCSPFFRDAYLHVAHAQGLWETGDRPAARVVVAGALERVAAIAQRVADPAYRETYLNGPPEHRRLAELALAWAEI